jgi:hypothetical protein
MKGVSMKRLLMLLATAGISVAVYAATATGGQQVVTPGQFAALKKQVTTLQKQVKTLNTVAGVLATCDFNAAAPFTNAPALHVSAVTEVPDFYVVATSKECADAMNTPSGLKHLSAKLGR